MILVPEDSKYMSTTTQFLNPVKRNKMEKWCRYRPNTAHLYLRVYCVENFYHSIVWLLT